MRINAYKARTSHAAPHHEISPLYTRGSIAAIVLRLEMFFWNPSKIHWGIGIGTYNYLMLGTHGRRREFWYVTVCPANRQKVF